MKDYTASCFRSIIVLLSFVFSAVVAFSASGKYGGDTLKKNSFLTPIPSTFDVGLSTNFYFHGLTPLEIYAYDVNAASSTTNTFNLLNVAPGITLRVSGDLGIGFEFSRNSVLVGAEYSTLDQYGAVVPVSEKIKLTNSQLKFLFFKPISGSPFYFGGSIDLGRFKTLRKYTGEGFSGKWQPFYSSTSLFKDVSPGTLTAGLGVFFGYQFNRFKFQLSRQFLLMDAKLSGYTGTDALFNTQHYQMSITYGF